jgi:hypothetical protein
MANHATLEAELFSILVELLGEGKLERNALRVLVGARGYELGRPYLHLCQQGLIEEERNRPGFFSRLFGARETQWVRVTDYGRKVMAEMATPPEEVPIEAPVEPAAPDLGPVVEAVEVALPAEPPAAVPAAEPVVTKKPRAKKAVAAEAPPAEAPAAVAPAAVAPAAVAPAAVAPPVAAPPVAADLAPELLPEAPPKPPKRKKPVTPRFAPSDFTETLGGAPVDVAPAIPASDRLDGLTETISLLGFELTEAGKMLAVHRWAQDKTDAQVVLEIVTTALAHAVRLDAAGTAKLDPEAAAALVTQVQQTFAVYVGEGLLAEETLTEASGQMSRFLSEAEEEVDLYLADAMRGMAPPAICPDGIYLRSEIAEE